MQAAKNLLIFFLILSSNLAWTHGKEENGITVTHAWSRAVPVAGMTGAGYMKIENSNNKDIRLIAIEADIAQHTSLHETIRENDMVSMQAVENGILIPAKSQVELQPGGLHLMLMRLKQPLEEGQQVPIKLIFDSGLEIATYLAIQPLTGDHMMHH